MKWINLFGLIIIILILLPNMIYFYKNRSVESNYYRNKVMNALEQIGRYGSMFLLVVNIGMNEFAFRTKVDFLLCLLLSTILILLYWAFWVLYFKRASLFLSMMLAIIPSILFLTQGIFLRYWLLLLTSLIFSISHCYITYQNATNHPDKIEAK